jgi:methyl-accepting chemotaxis protein
MVRKVDGAFVGISGDVAEVHDLLGNIAKDNNAQASAISEISDTVNAMDHTTQQNAAMVEQTSAAARNLASEVGQLTHAASQFDIGHQHERRASRSGWNKAEAYTA